MSQFLSTCGRHLVGLEGEPQRWARSLWDDVRRQLGAACLCAARPITPRGSSTAARALTPRRGRWGLSSFGAVRSRDRSAGASAFPPSLWCGILSSLGRSPCPCLERSGERHPHVREPSPSFPPPTAAPCAAVSHRQVSPAPRGGETEGTAAVPLGAATSAPEAPEGRAAPQLRCRREALARSTAPQPR